MFADLLTTLERLIGLGFSPFLALIIGFVIILGGVIASGFAFFWRQLTKERTRQDNIRAEVDKERAAWRKDIEERLDGSERQHNDCQKDRDDLRGKLTTLDTELTRLRRCPKADCPMRLPS